MENENTSPINSNEDLNKGEIGLNSDNAFSDKGLNNAVLTNKAINKGENRDTADKNQSSLFGMDEEQSLQSVDFATTENSYLNEHDSENPKENN